MFICKLIKNSTNKGGTKINTIQKCLKNKKKKSKCETKNYLKWKSCSKKKKKMKLF